jgi:hypothetical protein
MASKATTSDFVSLVAQEIACGIDRALHFWLGRIELEVSDGKLSNAERLKAIRAILQEYKEMSQIAQSNCASA